MDIKEELQNSEGYLLEMVSKEIKIPKLTIDNVARVEAMIQTDSRYSKSGNKAIEGTSANLFDKLKNEIDTNVKELRDCKDCITKIVKAIDKENSTHLKGIRNEIDKNEGDKNEVYSNIAEKICELEKDEFKNHLTDTEQALEEYGLFRIIESPNTGWRTNTSFASKFCHYACFYLFDDENRDNYSIYDEVMRKALPVYIKLYKNEMNRIYDKKKSNDRDNQIYIKVSEIINKQKYSAIKSALNAKNYKINDEKFKFYQVYQEVIDGVREASKTIIYETITKISRNGFDHLLWYYFKGKDENEIKAIYDCIKNDNN